MNKVEVQLFNSAADLINKGVSKRLGRYSVFGETKADFDSFKPKKLNSVRTGTTEHLIGRFSKSPHAEALEKGKKSKYYQKLWEQADENDKGKDGSIYIEYADSPNLKRWAYAKKLQKQFPKGVRIFGEGTRYGRKDRQFMQAGVQNAIQNIRRDAAEKLSKQTKI